MERLIVYKEPVSSQAEAYRTICMNVLAALGEKKIVEMAGVADNSDTSIVVANLAVAMAQAGKNVLVVDCNLRNPKQHELFGLQNRGLENNLKVIADTNSFAQQTVQQNLQVITADMSVTNPVEVLASTEMQTVLDFARKTYDIVLLDVPSVKDNSDAIILGSKTDAVLMILENKKDKVKQVQKAKEMFEQAGVNVLGCVLGNV